MTKDHKYALNELAWAMYKLNGYEAKEGYDFSKASHPQEVLMWEMANIAYDFVEQRVIEEETTNE